MLVIGDPAGAILAAYGQPPGNFGAAHGNEALIAVGVGTLGGANCTAPGQSRPMMPRSTKGLLGEMPASAATCLLAAGSSGKSPQR